MFTLNFKNDNEFDITLQNLNFDILKNISANNEFLESILSEKYYLHGAFTKINFGDYNFLISKINKKSVCMIYLE